ncbi:MAG TPA: sulfate adenylyltransferase subunit CysN [Bryobacteraceae bacterium]|nr:sulfate adenylyltransferase subunit CysN [Bryobacteraceae bacterium]
MPQAEAPAPVQSIETFLKEDQEKGLLRFTTAGSVDDGKSTLIGRLLYDSRGVYEDQIAAVRNSPVNRSTGPIDFSLLTDGLRAEREQGITIDVAYRYFATPKRKFIIADTPGHEQYTRNMATGASTADLAIVLIDAKNGVLPQSRRHAFIASLLGIPNIVVAVNKIDLVEFRPDVFQRIREEFGAHLRRLGIRDARFIPISALEGDNVISRSPRTPWYEGETLLQHLENVPLEAGRTQDPMRFPVQYVIRPDAHFRGYAGQLVSGIIRQGDTVTALPSGRTSRVKSIVAWEGEQGEAFAPMPATICLEDELDVSRGDMLVHPVDLPHVSRHFEATVVWMNDQPLRRDRPYLLKHTTQQLAATVVAVRHRIDINTLAEEPAERLELNEIGRVAIETTRPAFFDSYAANRRTGSFILIDPISNATVAAGMIQDPRPERVADSAAQAALLELEFAASRLTPAERFSRAGHYPATVWLTARQELAYLLERKLFERGCQVKVIAEEVESRILAEVAVLLNAAGLITILSVSSPQGSERDRTEARVGSDRFFHFEPQTLAASDDRAADQICAALESRGVLTGHGFREGEGI